MHGIDLSVPNMAQKWTLKQAPLALVSNEESKLNIILVFPIHSHCKNIRTKMIGTSVELRVQFDSKARRQNVLEMQQECSQPFQISHTRFLTWVFSPSGLYYMNEMTEAVSIMTGSVYFLIRLGCVCKIIWPQIRYISKSICTCQLASRVFTDCSWKGSHGDQSYLSTLPGILDLKSGWRTSLGLWGCWNQRSLEMKIASWSQPTSVDEKPRVGQGDKNLTGYWITPKRNVCRLNPFLIQEK